MEKAIIIALVLASILFLARRLLRIFKEDESPCSGCGIQDRNTCDCRKISDTVPERKDSRP